MYIEKADLNNLRQGDVISSILLPRFAIDPIECVYKMKCDNESEFAKKTIVNSELRFAVVISQCCEFNNGKRKSFSLAEMIPCGEWRRKRDGITSILAELVPFSRSLFRPPLGGGEDEIATLMAANEIVPGGKNSSVHAYCYKADEIHLIEPHVVDFTRITSISMGNVSCLLEKKVLQLSDEERRKFQLKLGYFFSRRG